MANAFAPDPKPSVQASRPTGGMRRMTAPCLGALAMTLVAASPAAAQTINNNGGSYNTGWNGAGSLNQGIDVATQDQNHNQTFINGILKAPAGSIFSQNTGVSQSSTTGGVGGQGLATAIGNSLNVVVQGSYNRVTVDSTQVNNGAVSANVSLNGQVNLNGP
jgi:holdfast attachment protein HfaA